EEIAPFYQACFGEDIRSTLSLVRGGHPDWEAAARQIKRANGFDPDHHAELRRQVRSGQISLAGNRLPSQTTIEDVVDDDVVELDHLETSDHCETLAAAGRRALAERRVAVVTFAAGVGSRWTEGAGVVKTVNPFVEMMGRHRSFAEIHLAKSRKSSAEGEPLQHVFTTSFLTHPAMERHLAETGNYGYDGPVYLSPARSIGQRLFPMERDLRFLWEEMPEQQLSEHAQRVRDDLRRTLIDWTRSKGEGTDYNENIPEQRFYPPGHWHEIPNLLRGGTLGQMLIDNPQLELLMTHNADTLGAWLDPVVVGHHLASGDALTFEVTYRRIEDVGGGLARVNGKPRLLEGSALPRQDDEYRLRYYNTLTTWISIDALLDYLGLTRDDIVAVARDDHDACRRLDEALRQLERRMPTYLAIKNVKLRWGAGQEDVYPVSQCEKLWGDMSSLEDLPVGYLVVPRKRGQQLKDPALLDHWRRDGSMAHVQGLCLFPGEKASRRGPLSSDIRPGRRSIDPTTERPTGGHPY
ncbi:MAG: UTP--glucose-1-phosphate uridylyltransferase, partial [Planctomycetota bacterium]